MRFMALLFCVLMLAGCQASGSANGSNANFMANILSLEF